MMIISNKLVIAGWNSVVIFVIIFCSLFATVIALFIQLRFQHHTTALKAALIFSLEPVFANVFDALLNREIVSPLTLTGGFLILLSILTPEIDSFFRLRIHNEID